MGLAGLAIAGFMLLSCNAEVKEATYQVIPLPRQITVTEGAAPFFWSGRTRIGYPEGNDAMRKNAEFLAEYVKDLTGMASDVQAGTDGKGVILQLDAGIEEPEGYRLEVDADGVRISGQTEAGVFYGIQTLRKSLPVVQGATLALPAVVIEDSPRFAYRGAHLDVSRHFFSVESVKRFIDMLALHNINRFHWHLSDDQGWRIEIKSRPGLTEIGSKRAETVIGHNSGTYDSTLYGGFYTQEEARDIVAYAADRHITVIPEIDMPGHMQAALAAYPELGCTGGPYEVWKIWGVSEDVLCVGNDATLQFIDDVLGEIIEIFPSEYIHVGGDECPKVRWHECPKCQARIRALGLRADKEHTAEEKLQSFLINHAEAFLNERGRQIIGWDEILEGGLAPNATVMSWRGEVGGIEAARQHHPVIMTPNTYLYFDYYQGKDIKEEPDAIGGYLPLDRVYGYEPVPAVLTPEERPYIIGVQANLWAEYIPVFSQVEYMELPRMAALAETQWSLPEKKDYADFLTRLTRLLHVYDVYGYNYAKHVYEVTAAYDPNPEEGTLDITLSTLDEAPIYYTLDGTEPSAESLLYTTPVKLKEDAVFKAVAVRPTGKSRVVTEEVSFNKASLKPITLFQPTDVRYTFNGASTLVDGLKGDNNYKTGRWIAFTDNDLEAVIDLLQPTEISSTSFSTCVVKGDWMFDARSFSVAVSEDGEHFREVASETYPALKMEDKDGVFVHTLSFDPVTVRYVKVKALSEHSLPDWHLGKGNPAHLFVDEIELN